MRFDEQLRRNGYEIDNEFGNGQERMQVWINRQTGKGILIEWFELGVRA